MICFKKLTTQSVITGKLIARALTTNSCGESRIGCARRSRKLRWIEVDWIGGETTTHAAPARVCARPPTTRGRNRLGGNESHGLSLSHLFFLTYAAFAMRRQPSASPPASPYFPAFLFTLVASLDGFDNDVAIARRQLARVKQPRACARKDAAD